MADENKNKEEVRHQYRGENPLISLAYGLYHAGVGMFIHSNPGEGKTSVMRFLAKILNVPIEILSGPQKEPTDFMGVAYIADVPVDPNNPSGPLKKELLFSRPKYARIAELNPKMILFFDELSAATPAVQTCMLSLIQDCVCGDISIPSTTWRVAAGNYSGMVGVKKMNLALCNRFTHIYYYPDASFVADGFVSGWTNYQLPKINPPEMREHRFRQYQILLARFFKENPQYVSKMPEMFENEQDAAFPSPRSWENVAKILSVLDQNDEKYLKELIIGTVGYSAGMLFVRKYLREVDAFNIDMNSFVGREKSFRIPHAERPDEVFNIMGSTMYYFQKDPKKYYPLWEHVVNTLHNKGNKYGDYAPFDAMIMTFLQSSLNIMLTKLSKKLVLLEKNVDDWVMLAGTYGDVRSDR